MILGFSSFFGSATPFYLLDLPTFQRDFAQFKTLDHATGPAITFTRASDGTFFDADGVLQTATNDAPRFDHDSVNGASRGLLIEEARTNSLRNSQAGGSTNGVFGSGGIFPTHWAVTAQTGISREIIGTGTVNGMAYIDMRFSGTATAGFFTGIQFDASSQIAALQNQTWTASAYVALVAGTLANVSNVGLGFLERDSGGVSLISGVTTSFTPSATLVRRTGTRTLTEASTAFYISNIRFTAASGQAVDFTLRIAAPQLEQGAFATSYIPTTSAAATRAADSAIVTPVSSFYNATEGTLFTAFRPRVVTGTRTLSAFDNDTEDEQVRLRNVDTDPRLTVNDEGLEQANIDAGTVAAATDYRLAAAFKLDDFAASLNGASAVTDTTGTMPTITHLRIGNSKAGNIYNGAIARLAYWPKRLPDAMLEQLTT
jgi:hypothetical protein